MIKTILFNPFHKFQSKILIITGIVATVFFSVTAYLFQARFDGAIDLHFVNSIEMFEPLIDNIVVILTLSFLLFFAGKIVNRKTRFVDLLAASLIARLPFYLLMFFNFNSAIRNVSKTVTDGITSSNSIAEISNANIWLLLSFAFTGLILISWYLSLLYKGYKVSCNAKNNTAILYFIIAIIGAEILSKYLIHLISL